MPPEADVKDKQVAAGTLDIHPNRRYLEDKTAAAEAAAVNKNALFYTISAFTQNLR